jgi:uncharacterized protein YbjT (DUF2867 family)
MTEPILVTGASGRVGGAVAAALRGRAPLRRAMRRPDGPDAVRFDFADPATHDAALDGAGAVFLMRPPAITRGAAFRPFLDAVVRHGIRRVAVLSVRGAERIRVLPHHAMEREVMARDLDWTMLRPSDFMQNLETVFRGDIRDRDEIALPAGGGRSPFVDVADVGAAAAETLLGPGHVRRGYDLTGPEALSFHDVAQTLSTVLGRPIRYRPLSVPRFVWERGRTGTPLPMALVMSALYTAQRLGRAGGPTDDLPRLLGRPATAFADWSREARKAWARTG